MWETIITNAVESSLVAALFVALLIYVLRDANKREKNYQSIIKELQGTIKVVADIQEEAALIAEKCCAISEQSEAIGKALAALNRDITDIKRKLRSERFCKKAPSERYI